MLLRVILFALIFFLDNFKESHGNRPIVVVAHGLLDRVRFMFGQIGQPRQQIAVPETDLLDVIDARLVGK